jgi:hypothetical protein
MRVRRPLIATSVVAVVAFSLLAVGCGGGSPATAVTTTSQNGALAYSHCMHAHGVPNFPDPDSSGEIPKQKVVSLVDSPQFRPAQSACEYLQPDGGPGQSAGGRQADTADMLAFARCLRSHGFPSVPDPTRSGELTPEMVSQAGINLHQPALLQAADACVSVTHGTLKKADVARALNESNAAGR